MIGLAELYFARLQQQQQNDASDENCHVPPMPSVLRCAPTTPSFYKLIFHTFFNKKSVNVIKEKKTRKTERAV